MENTTNHLILITSIINIPNIALSYTTTRSIFTDEQRFNQTKKTIDSIKEYIVNVNKPTNKSKIMLIECSLLTPEQEDYLIKNTDIYLNIFNNTTLRKDIYSLSKSLGESKMIITALKYLNDNKINYEWFHKISGRYWLNHNYQSLKNNINNDEHILTIPLFNIKQIATIYYKINYTESVELYDYLCSSTIIQKMKKYESFERIFYSFLETRTNIPQKCFYKKIGVNGYISVNGEYIDM